MPAYKDTNSNTWYCKFYYEDYKGETKTKFKRGFKRKKDAQEFERNFLQSSQFQPEIPFKDFIEIYKKDTYPQLREHTIQSKKYRLVRILPYFEDIPLKDITSIDIVKWQNEMIKLGFKSSYINNLQNQLSAILNHAVKFYGLKENPARKAGRVSIPDEIPSKMRFWTFDEYSHVIALINDLKAKTAINLLYWTGMRKGELFALTWADIDLENKTININKSHQRLKGKNVITPTKTYENRFIMIPDTTVNQILEYKAKCYDTSPDAPVFQWNKRFIENGIKQGSQDAEIEKIHVHGLRHSHASYLINQKVNIVLISKRLGHKDTSITLDTYSHFFPTEEINLMKNINKQLENK